MGTDVAIGAATRNVRMQVNLVMFKKGQRKDFPVKSATTTIGRKEDCGLRVPINDVSRVHCVLTVKGEQLVVKDLGSANGTYVNDRRVSEQALRPGDTLKVGPIVFTVQINGRPTEIISPDEIAALMDDSGELLESAADEKTVSSKPPPGKPSAPPAQVAADKQPVSEEDLLEELELLELDDSDDDVAGKK